MAFIKANNIDLDYPVITGSRSLRKTVFRASVASVGGLIKKRESGSRIVYVSALRNINLDLKEGDRIGLIGHNGSGKSTLLRVLAGIYEPTNGFVKTEGKVSALFQPGMGMDMEDSGYENIYNCGLYMGLSKRQIDELVPDIEQFTELGEFLTLPVRTYSSGMVLRLAFAITTAIEPEVLLLDESLGAGDASFTSRIGARTQDFISRAKILVMASHDNELLKSMCSKGMLLVEGECVAFGDIEDVLAEYQRRVMAASG